MADRVEWNVLSSRMVEMFHFINILHTKQSPERERVKE